MTRRTPRKTRLPDTRISKRLFIRKFNLFAAQLERVLRSFVVFTEEKRHVTINRVFDVADTGGNGKTYGELLFLRHFCPIVDNDERSNGMIDIVRTSEETFFKYVYTFIRYLKRIYHVITSLHSGYR